MIRVLFVCTGNICRSPTAEAVFRHYLESEGLYGAIDCDSAGTHGYHIGNPPDRRAVMAAKKRGVDMNGLLARKVTASDFDEFSWIVAMGREHYEILEGYMKPDSKASLHMFMDFAPRWGIRSVPDPYYGGMQGFEHVLDLVEDGSKGLLEALRRDLGN